MSDMLAVQLACKCDFADARGILWIDRASYLLPCCILNCSSHWLGSHSTKLTPSPCILLTSHPALWGLTGLCLLADLVSMRKVSRKHSNSSNTRVSHHVSCVRRY
jgi:hypothetical protein